MKPVRIYLLLHVVMTTSVLVHTFNPFEEMSGFFKKFWKKVYNPQESCDSTWISFNAEGLKYDLENRLIGQHIAADVILKTVDGFMSNNNPQKPLVLSLHGRTGTGKNFAARLIAENIFSQGMDSKYVHIFTADHHFRHLSDIETYKAQLHQQIKHNVSNCERSMFIFDEMEKMDPGLIDTIKPYLEHYNKLDGVSYRKAIFIFLSNAGGESITQTTLDFWKDGRDRKEIKLRDLELSLSVSAFNENNGLKFSDLINKHLVDYFVPFLPLEYSHVVQCVLAEMKARGLQPDVNVAEKVAKELVYSPKPEKIFSAQGCKTIEGRLYYI
ncbi:torsin-1A-like [Sparus aurata]|uniref:Torsin n=1 Tax=Sparus aurata TaxID=8175 RepID=A0A671WC14_SPAAU|nr:torsin-1A-like [Sparus aurata]